MSSPYDEPLPQKSQTFPSPPSTAGLSSHLAGFASAAADMSNQAATPAQDTPASMIKDTNVHTQENMEEQADTEMTDAPDHRRTNHQRQAHFEQSPGPSRGRVVPPVQLLCQIPHPISRPHPSQNLISLYGLDAIASSVARRDPTTGEKINKLRKSYEGKVKNLGLPGRNKPTDQPEELLGFMQWPDEGWLDQKVRGKELELADSAPMMAKLERALQMNPGRLPTAEHEKWRNSLALEDPVSARTPSFAPTKNTAQQAMLRSQPTSMRASAPSSPRASFGIRPDRTGKKRRYDESSYLGYSDGYQDDDGYSTGGVDDKRGSASKKRRKDFSPGFDAPNSGFNSSAYSVGVKST